MPSGTSISTPGNGGFDANTGGVDYGDSIVKLNSSGTVLDYFTPYNQATLDATDADLGASGLVLLPDQTGTYAHVLISSSKQGIIYSVNRDGMGKYNAAAIRTFNLWRDCRPTAYLGARPTGTAMCILLPGTTIYEPSR